MVKVIHYKFHILGQVNHFNSTEKIIKNPLNDLSLTLKELVMIEELKYNNQNAKVF